MFHITTDQQPIINCISDSLKGEDERLNVDYIRRNTTRMFAKSTTGSPNFVLFFTDIKSNRLYAEALPFSEEAFKGKKRETVVYGKAYSFLFLINSNGKIEKVYNGTVNYN